MLALAIPASSEGPGPEGRWRTIDDETGREKAVILIENVDGVLRGTIEEVFYYDDEEKRTVCEKCTGERKNKPLVGMNILWDMVPSNSGWDGGRILDPKNGKIYKCRMHLDESGNELIVRGFIGISLLGRSQKWVRIQSDH